MRRLARWLPRIVLGLAALAATLLLLAGIALRRSLPRESGTLRVRGLLAPVVVTRDAQGVPTLRGTSFDDVTFALGFVHAQERFFQMDLVRRHASGHLSELFGDELSAVDRERRAYDHERASVRHLAALPKEHRRWLQRYADGVNAGLADLGARPPEYLALRRAPEPWTPVDSLLVQASFFEMLCFGEEAERPLLTLEKALPPALVEFLTPDRSRLDTPPLGEDPPPPLAIPGPELVDLRTTSPVRGPDVVRVFGEVPASNNWAVTGSRTPHGGAILAGDPHLGITVPGIWYRAQLEWQDGARARRAVGATAPGLPGVVIGATDVVAWSMTNFFGDQQDLVPIEVDSDDPSLYRTKGGDVRFEVRSEWVAGLEVDFRTTVFGPVIRYDEADPRPLALASTAHRDGMTNLAILDILFADSLEDALDAGARWGGPSQNLLVAAADGRIGWVVTGCFPNRRGFDGKAPRSWADGTCGWDGVLDASFRPRVVLEDGVLFSANGRMVPLERARPLTRFWASSDRQRRIAELLSAPGPIDEARCRAMQLDTDLAALAPFRDVFLEVVPEGEPDPTLARWREATLAWNGTADADQRAVGILLALQDELRERVLGPLLQPARALNAAFVHNWMLVDEPLLRLLEERPPHVLPRGVPSWTAHLRSAVEAIARPGVPPLDVPWGDRNRLHAEHALARALPAFLANHLRAPAHPQPGTAQTLRAAGRSYGASLRLVASPSHLDQATLHLPIGQSGHPLSPHFMNAHEAWRTGTPVPLLPTPPATTFELTPEE